MASRVFCNRVPLPAGSVLAGGPGRYDYSDSYELELVRDISIDEALNAFCGPMPAAMRILMGVRDVVAGRLGLKTATRYVAGNPLDPIVVRSGDRIGLFLVRERHEREVVLGEDDSHLDFRVSVLVEERKVFVSTVVRYNNRIGRIYFAVVKPFHRWLVAHALPRDFRVFMVQGDYRGAASSGETQPATTFHPSEECIQVRR